MPPSFTPLTSLLGGALIGLGSALLLASTRRIVGVSSVVGGLVSASTRTSTRADLAWRAWFTLGLVLAGMIGMHLAPERLSMHGTLSLPWLVASGLLVGFGTRLGSGCTSGHGVCGLSRGSARSLVAVITFMSSAAIVVFLLRHLIGAH